MCIHPHWVADRQLRWPAGRLKKSGISNSNPPVGVGPGRAGATDTERKEETGRDRKRERRKVSHGYYEMKPSIIWRGPRTKDHINTPNHNRQIKE